jgi:hypothetical protein
MVVGWDGMDVGDGNDGMDGVGMVVVGMGWCWYGVTRYIGASPYAGV